MFCTKCGAELTEGAKFCAKCGASISASQGKTSAAEGNTPEVQAETYASQGKTTAAGGKAPKGNRRYLAAGLALLIALGGICGGLFFRAHREDVTTESGEADAAENAAAVQDWREMTPLYTIEDVPVIDIYAENYTPAAKAPGIEWDRTLFYWLEDVDQESDQDGYLAQCAITKTLMRRADTGTLVEYEIYRDPSDGTVYKVVSIENAGDHMDLTDYYYQQGGTPNFIFSRQDSVYTPTYATPAKTGSRYYFNNDVLARWRMITVPNEIGEYVLAPNGASYSQVDYYAGGAEMQAIYDEAEKQELNAARNTYDAVAAAGEGIGMVEGRVTDTAGNPVPDRTVDIVRTEDGALLYRAVTGEDGSFCIFVYLEEAECEVIVREDDTFHDNRIQGVLLSKSNGGSSLGNILLHRLDGDEYPVHILAYSAADVRTGEDGSLLRNLLPGGRVALREGAGAKTGEALRTLEADAEGKIDTTLPAGTYTAQIDVAGYATAYVTLEVAEQETTAEGYLLPAVPEGQTGVVLTWEGEADLDLTLFTPWQGAEGDMAHIGGSIAADGNGNSLVADNALGCEVMYVNTAAAGSYKLYVNDYTDSAAGNYSSDQLSRLNIHIYIYDSTGLIAELIFPAGQTGVVWEAADLNGGRVTPSQRVYASLEGKSWWTQSKWELNLEECENLENLLPTLANCIWTAEGWEQEHFIENLLTGEESAVKQFLGEAFSAWYPVPYISNEVAIDSNGVYSLRGAQMKEIISSLSGSIPDMSWLQDELSYTLDGWTRTEGIRLQDYRMEDIGAGKWNVTATGVYVSDWSPGYLWADITFTITRNPDSSFDGYSIIGIEVVNINNNPPTNITWETVDYNIVNLHFAFENGLIIDREILAYDVQDIMYEDITGDGVDDALIYCDFVNTAAEYQLIYFYQLDEGSVTDISPSARDIPELGDEIWDVEKVSYDTEGYSSPVYQLESYTKEDGVTYVGNTLYVGYKNGRWELVQSY